MVSFFSISFSKKIPSRTLTFSPKPMIILIFSVCDPVPCIAVIYLKKRLTSNKLNSLYLSYLQSLFITPPSAH